MCVGVCVCVCVCVCVYHMCVCACITCVCMHVCVVCIYVCGVSEWVSECVCVCVCVCGCVCVSVYVLCVCHVNVYGACLHVCMHTHVRKFVCVCRRVLCGIVEYCVARSIKTVIKHVTMYPANTVQHNLWS